MDYTSKEDSIEYIFEKAKHLIVPSESNNFKSKLLQSNILLCGIVLLLLLKVITTLVTMDLPKNIFFADITKITLENFVNQTRQSAGLNPLTENQKLNQAAELKAQNMVQNNYFDHVSPSGITPWFWFSQVGYKYKYAGENLAIGFYESSEVYNAWLNSPSHKANIVNPNYTEVGTAVLKGFGQDNSIVVVQEFGSQLSQKASSAKNNSVKPVITTNTKTIINTPKVNKTITNPAQSTTVSKGNVLSQSTITAETPKSTTSTNLPKELLKSALSNYELWLQNVIYGVSLVVTGILITLILFNFHISFKKKLVYRAVLVIALLSTATLLNKEVIIALFPHQIFI